MRKFRVVFNIFPEKFWLQTLKELTCLPFTVDFKNFKNGYFVKNEVLMEVLLLFCCSTYNDCPTTTFHASQGVK